MSTPYACLCCCIVFRLLCGSAADSTAGHHDQRAHTGPSNRIEDVRQHVQQVQSQHARTLLQFSSLFNPFSKRSAVGGAVDPRTIIPDPEPRLWLYMSVAAHFPSASSLLKHYLDHYLHRLKFPRETFLLVVNFKSSEPQHQREYQRIQDLLQAEGVGYTLWGEEYSSPAHLILKYKLLHSKRMHPEDWIILTDLDEFHRYPLLPRDYFKQLDSQGYNFIKGRFVDRVSLTGKLKVVADSPGIEQQFPLKCNMVEGLYKGETTKAMAYKAYLRSDRGNHNIVPPERGRRYFRTLFGITPYREYYPMYCRLPKEQEGQHEQLCPKGSWYVRMLPELLPVDHYKWQAGLLESAERRLAHYRGNATSGGKPLLSWYKDSELILKQLGSGGIDVNDRKKYNCSRVV